MSSNESNKVRLKYALYVVNGIVGKYIYVQGDNTHTDSTDFIYLKIKLNWNKKLSYVSEIFENLCSVKNSSTVDL